MIGSPMCSTSTAGPSWRKPIVRRLSGTEMQRAMRSKRPRTSGRYSVWVPQTPHTSRDLLILVEKSTEQVLSSDLVDLGFRPVGEQL
jgi:hypothetical protein